MVKEFFLGIVLALLYSELTGIVPGGIIVPAFVASTLDRPERAILTVVAALLAMALYRLAAQYLLLFGRRRFVFLLLLGAFLNEIISYFYQYYLAAKTLTFLSPEARVIGLIIPGLLASNLERQKFWLTLASFINVTIIIYFLGKLLS